ncbi:HlyD family type I secretion periplasmic adaptor subunit [Hydrogenophilus thiooxidans]|uniref:HlyD family type I secretion periplasmic adaptor subunit n=1 Tax=Hydrogenophilus thiooxidans TaxID=2820326 RepID=UPI001C2380D0|nr:HlyD family type I secretion periplasmic adaptor subunit [Hydrogenophilus thiooxidans]
MVSQPGETNPPVQSRPETQQNPPARRDPSNQAPEREQTASAEAAPIVLEANARPVETVAHEVLPDEATRFLRIGVWILLLFFGGFLVWAATAPLDAGVPAPGVTIVESKRKTVSHLTGGIVKAILVQDMTFVEAGQPLIILDDTTVSAQYQSALKEYAALLATKARLEAERSGAKAVTFPQTLYELGATGDAAQQIAQQQALFRSRQEALAAQLRVLDETARTAEQNAAARTEQLQFLKEQLDGMRALAQEGYAPRNTQLELERQALELQNQITLAKQQAKDARLRAQSLQEEYRKEVETHLAEVTKQLAVVEERVRALKEELERTVIRAPVAGYVNALAVHTVGGVVRPGEPLLEIIPKDEKLVFEVQVPPHHIERVHPGLLAEVQLANFHDLAGKVLEGRVISVSADLVTDRTLALGSQPLPPHYLARVELTENGWQTLGPNRHLQPGMPVTVLIKTGERTFLQYLIKPIWERLHSAVKEP